MHPVRASALTARTSDFLKADLELPVHELLFPVEQDIALAFTGSFVGMTSDPVSLDDLLTARTRMMQELQTGLHAAERGFLLSLVAGEPDCELLGIPHISQLPGVQWKMHNLEQLKRTNPAKLADQHARLVERFESADQRRG